MKIYLLITAKEWRELQEQVSSYKVGNNGLSPLKGTFLQQSQFKKILFRHRNEMDEAINYCVKNQDNCKNLYSTLEKLGLYYGRNTYNKDDAKFTKALQEALITERAILLEKPVEHSSGMLPPQSNFLTLPSNTIPRKLTPAEILEQELKYYNDEENWIEISVKDLPNQPFTLFDNATQKQVYQGNLDNKGYAYVKLPLKTKYVDVLFDKQSKYQEWYYDVPWQILGGVRDGAQNILNLGGEFVQQKTKLERYDDYSHPFQVLFSYFMRKDGEDLQDVLKKQVKTVNANIDKLVNPIVLPEVDAPTTMAGALTHGVTQFLSGYLTSYRIIRPITKIGPLLKGMVAGVIADSTVMAPNEERLSNLIEDYPQLKNPITDYLQAKPDDSEAEGRLKNAIEGLIVGAIAEPFIRSLRLLKYARVKAAIKNVKTKFRYKLDVTYYENHNVVNYEKYKDILISKMEKPIVADDKLQDIINELYRDNAKIGSGSTADAVRYEMNTGFNVGGKTHTQKANNYSSFILKWLEKNPNASASDRAVAENILRDMQNALNGK